MANPIKGEVDINDGDQSYRLVFDINAFIEATNVLGMKMDGLQEELKSVPVEPGVFRALLFGALREHHPSASLFDAGRLMVKDGVATAVGEALRAAFPDAPEGGNQNPPKRALPRGTGKRST